MPAETTDAEYVFGVRFRLTPARGNIRVDPATFETTLRRQAPPPGEEGWLFFRDNLWRGELSDPDHFRELTEEALGVTVEAVDFREFQTDQEHLDEFRDAIAEDLAAFNAETVDEAIKKYLGSSIRVR